jgi:hypothetical protein|tara:strand:- start:154 stop:327 length:174 start_codon:yes stop_codon:yes gene_type:complete
MSDEELIELRLKIYNNFTQSVSKQDAQYNQQLLKLIDFAVSEKKALENITKEGISHI